MKTHKNPITKMIAISLKLLKKSNPKLRLVVSFADVYQGHHGGIYQGGNWIYTGLTSPTLAYFDKKNRQIHPRNVGSKTEYDSTGVKKYNKNELRKEVRPGKHRYLMPLDDEMRIKIAPLAKPYPKRQKQAMTVPTEQRRCDTDPDAPIDHE
jgi:hypothetical protein